MCADDHAGPAQHDEAEVQAYGPEDTDDADAVEGFGAEDGALESRGVGGCACG